MKTKKIVLPDLLDSIAGKYLRGSKSNKDNQVATVTCLVEDFSVGPIKIRANFWSDSKKTFGRPFSVSILVPHSRTEIVVFDDQTITIIGIAGGRKIKNSETSIEVKEKIEILASKMRVV